MSDVNGATVGGARVISTGCFGIVVTITGEGGGSIVSALHDDGERHAVRAAIDAIESLILSHAVAGIDIASPAYLNGIETAVVAIWNEIDE